MEVEEGRLQNQPNWFRLIPLLTDLWRSQRKLGELIEIPYLSGYRSGSFESNPPIFRHHSTHLPACRFRQLSNPQVFHRVKLAKVTYNLDEHDEMDEDPRSICTTIFPLSLSHRRESIHLRRVGPLLLRLICIQSPRSDKHPVRSIPDSQLTMRSISPTSTPARPLPLQVKAISPKHE